MCSKLFCVVVAMFLLSTTAIAETPDVRLSGFVDFATIFYSANSANSGPRISDGAVYLKSTFDQAELIVDLPFSSSATGTSSNNFLIGTDKAQAYVAFKYSNGLRWKAGQFDGLFGFEAADSCARRFTLPGIVGEVLPFTHTGLLVGYDFNDVLGMNLYSANPNSSGVPNGNRLEFGAQLNYSKGPLRGTLGYSHQEDNRFVQDNVNSILNLIGGFTINSFNTDLEFDLKRTAGISASAWGVAGHFGYGLSEKLEVGARLEYMKDAPKAVTLSVIDSKYSVTVGPQLWLAKNTRLLADYTWSASKEASTSELVENHIGALSVQYKF